MVIAGIITALGGSQSTPVLTPQRLEQRDWRPAEPVQKYIGDESMNLRRGASKMRSAPQKKKGTA